MAVAGTNKKNTAGVAPGGGGGNAAGGGNKNAKAAAVDTQTGNSQIDQGALKNSANNSAGNFPNQANGGQVAYQPSSYTSADVFNTTQQDTQNLQQSISKANGGLEQELTRIQEREKVITMQSEVRQAIISNYWTRIKHIASNLKY
jgi:Tfp pilus assembly protein FimT